MKAKKNAKALAKHGSAEAKAFNEAQEPDPIPEDLGVRMGTKRERLLTKVKKVREQEIEECLETIDINKVFIQTLEAEIAKEKEKFK